MQSVKSNILLLEACQKNLYYRNKIHMQVLYDGFKLATKPEGLSALIQPIDSLKPS